MQRVVETHVGIDATGEGSRARALLASTHLPVAVGSLLRLAFAMVAPLAPQWDGEIYVRGARLLASGESYSQRILDAGAPDLPTAFYPVGLPALLSVVRRLGGGLREDLLLQALAGSASLYLLAELATRLVGARIARNAVWLYALAPGAILLTGTWLAEPWVTFGLLAGLVLATRLAPRRPHLAAIALGLGMGVTAYLRATPLVVAPLVAFGIGWSRKRSLRHGAALATIACACSLVPLMPWAARNLRELHAPVLVSTNGGVNLLIGTVGDGSYQDVARPARCGETAPEVELDRCRAEVAEHRILRHPIAWGVRGISKLWHTFGHESAPSQHLALANRATGQRRLDPWLLSGLARMHWFLMAGFALFGALARSTRRATRAHAALFGPVLALALLHFVYLGGDRYHAPVAPLLAILAAEALAHRTIRRTGARACSEWRPT